MYSSQGTSPENPFSSTSLRRPEPPDSLGNTDIVGLERVQRNAHKHCSGTQSPVGGGAGLGHAVLGEVVDDARLEADVRVDDQEGAEDGVGDGVQRAGGEGGDCEGNEAGGDDSGGVLVWSSCFMIMLSRWSLE